MEPERFILTLSSLTAVLAFKVLVSFAALENLLGSPSFFGNIVKSKRLILYFTGILMVVFSSSCSEFLPTPALPTLIPTEYLPTAVAQTVQALHATSFSSSSPTGVVTATPTLIPTSTSLPATETVRVLTSTPTPYKPGEPARTSTPSLPDEIPFSEIQFISPGALSKVVSPIELHAFLVPSDSGRVRVELFGEDGRLMFRKLFILNSPPGYQANLRSAIDFEINGVAETATLVISVDDRYGRLKTLASEPLILLSLGESDLNPPDDFLAPLVIQQPEPKVLIQGGTLVVSGLVRKASDQPLLVELITTDGKVIGSRLASVADQPEGGHRLFAAKIPYQVNSPTWVRVTVSESGGRLDRPLRISSVEILLSP